MKKILIMLVVSAITTYSAEYSMTKKIRNEQLIKEGILFDTDTISTGDSILTRDFTSLFISVNGLDSGKVIIEGKIGADQKYFTNSFIPAVDTSNHDAGSTWFRLDSIGTNGLYNVFDSVQTTYVRARLSVKRDFSVVVRFLGKSY